MYTVTRYVCENCKEEHADRNAIGQCELCHDDLCENCQSCTPAAQSQGLCSRCYYLVKDVVQLQDKSPNNFKDRFFKFMEQQ